MWLYLLVTFIVVVAVYFHSRITKSADLREINNNFKTVLDQQKDLARETGKIKQALDQESISYQVRLSSYNEKSIAAISGVYIALIALRDCAKKLALDRSPEVQTELLQCVQSFRGTFDTQRIWMPAELATRIEAAAIDVDARCNGFIRASTMLNNVQHLAEDRVSAAIDEQERFYDFITQEISAVFDGVVHQISTAVRPGVV